MTWALHKEAQVRAGLAGRVGADLSERVSSCSVPLGCGGGFAQGRSGKQNHTLWNIGTGPIHPQIPAAAASHVGSL